MFKQKLLGEIFQKAYVRWGLHYPSPSITLSYAFRLSPSQAVRSIRTFWIAPLIDECSYAIFANRLYIQETFFYSQVPNNRGKGEWWFWKNVENVKNGEVEINGKVEKVRTTDGQLFKILCQSEIKWLRMYRFCREYRVSNDCNTVYHIFSRKT